MEKEFVSYEIALALKELGFDEPCLLVFYGESIGKYEVGQPKDKAYLHNGFFKITNSTLQINNNNYNSTEGQITQPTIQSVFRWFREKYSLVTHIETDFGTEFYVKVEEIKSPRTLSLNQKRVNIIFKTYEEAESACIDKLIELVKEKINHEA